MNAGLRASAIEKMAFFGPAGVTGSPVFRNPGITVGQIMNNIRVSSSIPPMERRKALDGIVASGIDVNAPGHSLLKAGLGAVAANAVAGMLGAGPFLRGVSTVLGARYGYSM